MAKRRERGEGSIHWDESRGRWVAEVTIGYAASGKRQKRRSFARTKSEVKENLRQLQKELDEGDALDRRYTVTDLMRDFLRYGMPSRSDNTMDKLTRMAENHIIPDLGARKARCTNNKGDLTADDVDRFLEKKARELSTRTLREMLALLRRALRWGMKRDKVKRNVALLCELPEGRPGRPSKSLTFEQAQAVMAAAAGTPMYAYIVLSLLTGLRTEEVRALAWDRVDLDGEPNADPPIPPHVMVWRSVRDTGDTKTRKSRRSLALPKRCVDALRAHKVKQEVQRRIAGDKWEESGLVFASAVGTELDHANVRRAFRNVIKKTEHANVGLVAKEWTPRELRHSFVSLLSDRGMPIEQISRLMGHNGTAVTELVYRHQIRPVIEQGAETMDHIFKEDDDGTDAAA